MKRHRGIQIAAIVLAITLLAGCSGRSTEDSNTSHDNTTIQVFVAASLNNVMSELATMYQEQHPEIKIVLNADSSGKLLTQIEEGYVCDIFFSAAVRQIDQLETDGLMVEGSREEVVSNRLVVITRKNSETKVTGLQNLNEATSLALAEGSVPAGRYTRQALVKLGILEDAEDVSKLTTKKVSEALGDLEISEQGNVSKVLIAVTEGSCEVGTIYYSDLYGYEDKIEVIEQVSNDLTGEIIFPICRVKNPEATSVQEEEAEKFYQYILSEEANDVFKQFYFDTGRK
jgi:molybdate transport system substrate-binding protein